jgi:hypothetical protein
MVRQQEATGIVKSILQVAIFIAALAALPVNDSYGSVINAGEMLDRCTAEDNGLHWAYCMGHLSASWDWLNFIGAVFDGHQIDAPKDLAVRSGSCIPDGVTLGQLRNVFVKYVQDNPQIEHESAWLVFAKAVKEAFCE